MPDETTTTTTAPDPPPSVDPDRLSDAFRALQTAVRRVTIAHAREHADRSVTITELCERVRTVDGNRRDERLEAALRHVHLPLLSDLDVIDYDPRQNELRYTGHEAVEAVLADVPDEQNLQQKR